MDRNERIIRLKKMVTQIAENGDVQSLIREPSFALEGLEAMPSDQVLDESLRGVQKVASNQELSDSELFGLEAIILPRERPVIFIQNNSYGELPDPWTHYTQAAIRRRIEAAIPSVGRIELPDTPWIPFGGTGFVVGDDLLMTNRHVAELFARGLGVVDLTFRPGQSAAIDFLREVDSRKSVNLRILSIAMIHPHWDMAILRVAGLPAGHSKLTLSVLTPEELNGREVAVIGYPAQDARNDLELQDRIFNRVYNVKRLHPGKIRPPESINSFGHPVNAMTHDSSTLGGNSGSAVLDVTTGHIVGLHFAGIYLRANYCVPTYELARDSRVVQAGLNFASTVNPTDEWLAAWRIADPESPGSSAPTSSAPPSCAPSISEPIAAAPTTNATLPVTIRVEGNYPAITIQLTVNSSPDSVRMPTSSLATTTSGDDGVTEGLKEPIIAGSLGKRKGYQPGFLGLDDDEEVPMPTLTAAGKRIAAAIDNGSTELKYHKFSVVMHKKRRLALFTAANVDWRKDSRLIDGHKPTRKELTGLEDRDSEKWVTDPRIPEDHQLPDVFFTDDNQAWDKGHLVRRDDVCWGKTLNDIRMANGDTFHTTNCSPQTLQFNRSNKGKDNWGQLENLVQKQSRSETLCLFSGPVLQSDDPIFVGVDDHGEVRVQIPRKFWKIIVAKGPNGPEAYGFVLEQDLSQTELEFAVPTEWHAFMKPISEIEEMLNGLARLTWHKKHDRFGTLEAEGVTESVAAPMQDDDSPPPLRANVETAGPLTGLDLSEGLIQGATFQNRQVKFSVLNNRAIFEGDIDLGPLEQISAFPESGLEAIGVTGASFRWPNRKVPYSIDQDLPNPDRVTQAIAHWEAKTRIRFVQRTNQVDYVTFRSGDGCSSSIGRRGGQQFVTLGPNCTAGNAIHEIGHTVGLWHEQSREDRDRFVTIDFSNVQSGMEHNFLQHITDGDDIGAYDFGSIMHYPANAFSKDPTKPTIRTRDGESIGQRIELSPGDIAGVEQLYP
jgi:DNA/RNA endonuclease G (NUC1)